ncbi:Cro/CI family transcriptional regulator [uncultured Pseudomonas sp.]|uniref:Cro/CI family transcriptional regulator n=1 Tax=uncultured Pseudomonas sp. TaxID=114707 RepID=UPI0025CCDAEE|nr:Cro/CI family transcriptional regulator [uncultured Pseudomonas sp.]
MADIKTADAAKALGSKRALAKAIGRSESAVYRWGEYVPRLAQNDVAEAMKRKARADKVMQGN